MSAKARAALFAAGALGCAVLAAAAAGTRSAAESEELGALRDVAVTRLPLARGAEIGPQEVRDALAVRRVPESFMPPDAVAAPVEALGLRVAVPLPAGSYLTGAVLASAARSRRGREGPPRGTSPVEIEVTGAGALAGATRPGTPVDVVVSGGAGPGPATGRTYVAASRVPLLALTRASSQPGLGERWSATLALTRAEALELIRAESLGRVMRLLGR